MIGRISSRPRPSIRMPSSRTSSRTVFFWTRPNRPLPTRAVAPRRLEQRRRCRRRSRLARIERGDALAAARRSAPGRSAAKREQQAARSPRRPAAPDGCSRARCRRTAPASPSLYASGPGIALAGEHQRVEVACPARSARRRRRLLEEAEVEADVVADDVARRRRTRGAARAASSASGRPSTSLSVRPWIWLPTIGAARVHERRPAVDDLAAP